MHLYFQVALMQYYCTFKISPKSHRWRLLRTGRRQSLSQTFQKGPANKLLNMRWGWTQNRKKCIRIITDSMMSRTEWRILDCFSLMSCEHQFVVKLTSATISLFFFILIGQLDFFVVILIERSWEMVTFGQSAHSVYQLHATKEIAYPDRIPT